MAEGFDMDTDLLRRTADLRALADIRLVTLDDGPGRGQRLLIGRNANGVAFEIAVDRGFDVSGLSFRGTNVGWHSPTQMVFPTHDPDSEEGLGFSAISMASWSHAAWISTAGLMTPTLGTTTIPT